NSNQTTQVIPRPNKGGIKDAKVDEAGHLIISLDDGRTIDAGLVRGKDGRDGRDGKDGKDGKDGQDGLTPDIKPVFDKNGKQIG
ncbi:hypothetical protein QP363_13315, partial [Corynebacterium sp. UMB6689]|nr:hypothetical protein [Corynebacterium sp. UMB6689]